MSSWKASAKDQKQYPHFDAPLSKSEMERIANDPDAVAKNRFYPFLKYDNAYRPFRPSGKGPKVREIRYGARRDAAIFSRYRHLLSELYEKELSTLGLTDNVLAYRRILVMPGSSVGKSNIHHAKSAFDTIKNFSCCCAITLDISKYFESVDHKEIYKIWCRLLGKSTLPDDHYSVFKAITKYAIVDSKEAYSALGYFGTKASGISGYLVSKKDMPKQLCSPEDFRNKICGKAPGFADLVKKNKLEYGIPQGAPLSDLLANAYLIDFDVEMATNAKKLGGYYMRYSDDILFILPINSIQARDFMMHVQRRIEAYGSHLRIKEEKCTIDRFTRTPDGMEHKATYPAGKSRNGLNYLGFRFDGKKVYLRDSTLSNFWRKIARATNAEARNLVYRFPGKDKAYLEKHLNTEVIIEKFGRVRNFDGVVEKKSWTFWTYVKRASTVFGREAQFYSQIRGYKKAIRKLAEQALSKYLIKAKNP
ncbi:MAG: hypothetical protein KDE22_15315 [Rhodobacterales bacterium]|nr:hypothetical protein [Rhodobacterales bacterium]